MAQHVMKMILNDAFNNDLNIFYYGGAGGFFFLNQLLLTGNFYCHFGDEYSSSSYLDINKKQFNIYDMKFWKNTEVWPRNELTERHQTSLRKIYFHCNDIKGWVEFKKYKICLYTDIKTQLRMAIHKKSFFYHSAHDPNYNEKNYISYTKCILKNNHNILRQYKISMKKANLNVKFQDLLSLEGLENFLNSVGGELKQENIDFLKHYLSLHPKKLLDKIGVNNEIF